VDNGFENLWEPCVPQAAAKHSTSDSFPFCDTKAASSLNSSPHIRMYQVFVLVQNVARLIKFLSGNVQENYISNVFCRRDGMHGEKQPEKRSQTVLVCEHSLSLHHS